MSRVKVRKLLPNAITPRDEGNGTLTLGAYCKSEAGHDIKLMIPRNTPRLVRTGIAVELPTGYLSYLMSRRDSAKQGLFVVNSPLVQDLNGEIQFVLMNSGLETHYVCHGDWIAHLVFFSGVKLDIEVV
jgi:dUTPase